MIRIKWEGGVFMPFEILRQDITKMAVDAIVNSTSAEPSMGGGADYMIHLAAGPKLLEARHRLGVLEVGQAVLTEGYGLLAKYVIHVLAPIYVDGRQGEHQGLYDTYSHALKLAQSQNIQSLAMPLIGTGAFAFPRGEALETALQAIKAFLANNEMQIYLVVYDEAAYQISRERFNSVRSYLDNYHEKDLSEKISLRAEIMPSMRRSRPQIDREKRPRTLAGLMNTIGETFSACLLRLIDEKGLDDVTVYKKANLDRKLFSKIRSHTKYQPSKQTAIALALALELNLDETQDFIGKAGFALSPSQAFDLIIQYFIEANQYDIYEINQALFAFGEKTLGNMT